MDMRIYSDKWFIIQDMSNEFRSLNTYSRQLHQFFKSARYTLFHRFQFTRPFGGP